MKKTATLLRESQIDFEAFKRDVKKAAAKKGWTLTYLNEEVLLRSATYLSACFYGKSIPVKMAIAVCKALDLKLADYEIKPEPPKPEPEPEQIKFVQLTDTPKGWSNTLSVNLGAKIVSLAFFKDGQKVASGRAKIFDETDHGIMQAISYAAHMCYKFSEQRELFNQNRENTVGGFLCKTTNSTESTQTSRRQTW